VFARAAHVGTATITRMIAAETWSPSSEAYKLVASALGIKPNELSAMWGFVPGKIPATEVEEQGCDESGILQEFLRWIKRSDAESRRVAVAAVLRANDEAQAEFQANLDRINRVVAEAHVKRGGRPVRPKVVPQSKSA
jgi:hypothetical protein